MAEIKQLKQHEEIFYPVTVGEAVIFEDGRSVKDKIEKLSTYIETTYSNLKSLRDNNQLIPGALYRITDYVTTTIQDDTRSAGHQFDVIVQAISESVLSEDARAIQHKFGIEDMPQTAYSPDNGDVLTKREPITIDGIKYCVYTPEDESYKFLVDPNNPIYEGDNSDSYQHGFWPNYSIDNEDIIDSGIAYGESICFKQDLREFSYFSNSNLAAWKLKYCLDNDTNRFAWAKNLYLSPISHNKCISLRYTDNSSLYVRQSQLDNENGCAWCFDDQGSDLTIKEYNEQGAEVVEQNIVIYTPSEDVYIGQNFTINGDLRTVIDFSEQGKGVIYQMIDEHNNDCPYDFKNIQFLRSLDWNQSYEEWCTEVLGMCPDEDVYYYTFTWVPENGYTSLEDTSVTSFPDDENEFVNARNNVLMEYLNGNKIELNNIILVSSYFYDGGLFWPQKNNTFKQNCYSNTFGNNIRDNVFDFYNFNWIVFNDYEENRTFGSVYSAHLDTPTNFKIILMNPASGSIRITRILDYPNT